MNRNPSITVRDVARVANVSIATVSHVVNHSRNVKASTRARVESAIEQLGYHHNMIARELKTGSSGLIGVLIVDYNPFYTDVLKGIEDRVEGLGWKFVVASTGELWERQQELIRLMVARRMQGILVAPVEGFEPEYIRSSVPADIPVILFDRTAGASLPAVASQNSAGAQLAVQHLAEHGYTRLGIAMSNDDISTMNERRDGFAEAARTYGLTLQIERATPDPIGGYRAAKALLAQSENLRPQAIIALNNVILIGVLKLMRELGIEVGVDVAVLGFDDQPWCEVMEPSLTVINQNAYEMGQQAVNLLTDALAGRAVASHMLEMELRIRRSCGCK